MFALDGVGASVDQIERGNRAGQALIAAYGLAAEFVQAAARAQEEGRAHDEEAARVWYEAERAAIRAAFGRSSRARSCLPDLAQAS